MDLSKLGDKTIDFAFSHIVLQHMPELVFALRYIREMLRVLKPGGMFLFQFNWVPTTTMNWKSRMAWRMVDFPWARAIDSTEHACAGALRRVD
jgi:SAM-dependent methyltransferase